MDGREHSESGLWIPTRSRIYTGTELFALDQKVEGVRKRYRRRRHPAITYGLLHHASVSVFEDSFSTISLPPTSEVRKRGFLSSSRLDVSEFTGSEMNQCFRVRANLKAQETLIEIPCRREELGKTCQS